MATLVVSIICLALIIMGGISMSQGILSSADATALSVEEISVREGEIMRTDVSAVRAENLSWADLLRITVENNGQTKIAGFNKWDLFVHYYDGGGSYHTEWLPFTEGDAAANEWQKATILLNGQPEFFEPGIVNHQEELVILANISPLPRDGTFGDVTIVTPNGVCGSLPIYSPGYTLLTPHSENTTIAGTDYFQMAEATTADGTAITMTSDGFIKNVPDRKILYDENDPSRPARHVFALTGISDIPSGTWTVYYHCRTWGDPKFPKKDNDVNFDIDILIRQADGTIRETIASGVADAYLGNEETEVWVTKSGTYEFPGYTVVDETDYLEIVFYGEVDSGGPQDGPGYMQLRIDDSTLSTDDQTRITG
jgi:hypothetical protein